MLIKKPSDIPYSEVTPKSLYINRRKFITGAAVAAGAAALLGRPIAHWIEDKPVQAAGTKLENLAKSPFSTTEKQTPYKDVTNYNNYYEFSTDKFEPAKLAQNFKTRPWTVSVEGEIAKPEKFDIDSIMKLAPLEERIYRHRCVEGWSIVVPWIGYPLGADKSRAAEFARPSLCSSSPTWTPSRCLVCVAAVSTGRTPKDYGWTRR